jgi:lactoylglutathione lyase
MELNMNINHIALYVNDLEKMKVFYEKYFDAKSNEMYHNQNTGLKTYFLEFSNECRIEIMTKGNLNNIKKEPNNTGYIHLAFSVGSKDKVNDLTQQLENEGYKIISRPRITGDGYYESCIVDPEDNQIEIVE